MKRRVIVSMLALGSSCWALVAWLRPGPHSYFIEPAGHERARPIGAPSVELPVLAPPPGGPPAFEHPPETRANADRVPRPEVPAEPAPAVAPAAKPAGPESVPSHPLPSFTSRDGRFTFRVPSPSDPEYADYLEMLRHPAYRSAGEGAPGFVLPYDPEWRSVITGRRAAAKVDAEFESAMPSLEDLAREIVQALRSSDTAALHRLRLDQREFTEICWPEFPQSRPYLKIPASEAWSLHSAQCAEGVVGALSAHGGESLEVHGIEYGVKREYLNFTLYEDVVLRVRDAAGVEGPLHFVRSIAERKGSFKVFIYHG